MTLKENIREGIALELDSSVIGVLYPFLQRGVRIRAEKGSSIKVLLCDTMSINPEYVDQRIQTIFLDGKPVDDPASTVLDEGSRIALSAAMPGLAGATLRRDGFFAGMRSQITHRSEHSTGTSESCFVTVRLFNLLIEELAPKLLATGIWLTDDELRDLLELSPNELAAAARRVVLQSGQEGSFEELRAGQWGTGVQSICVIVRSGK